MYAPCGDSENVKPKKENQKIPSCSCSRHNSTPTLTEEDSIIERVERPSLLNGVGHRSVENATVTWVGAKNNQVDLSICGVVLPTVVEGVCSWGEVRSKKILRPSNGVCSKLV